MAIPVRRSAGPSSSTSAVATSRPASSRTLTCALEEKAWTYLEKIEAMGGMFKAIESGFIQREIQESAYKYQKQIESKDRIIVGLNEYVPDKKEVRFRLHQPPRKNESAQRERLRRLRRTRSSRKVEKKLASVERAARAGKNILPFLIAAVRAEATLGEISDSLRKVYGTYREALII